MEEDDGFHTSDAEVDSEIEDTDVDGELGVWLDQLNAYSQEPNGSSPKKAIRTQTKCPVTPKQAMDTFRCSIVDTGDVNLDDILGELCQLEDQLSTQQLELRTSLDNTTSNHMPSPPKPLAEKPKPAEIFSSRLTEPNLNLMNGNRDSLAELELALDDQLQNALSELGDLVGITFDSPSQGSSASNISGAGKCVDYLPDNTDSAYSDSSSLPSSGSHVSVTTTSSQHSNGSGAGNVSAEHMFGIMNTEDVAERLSVFRESLILLNLPPVEQAAQLKAEKMKIALEKIKEANIQKLFVRFYGEDGCSKSILVDESMRVAHILDRLVTKNNVTPSVNWAIVEHLPDLYMERLVEDHELMVEPLLTWNRHTRNKLLFVQSPGKYHIFHSPEFYLDADKKNGEVTEADRMQLIEEYFSEINTRFPEIEGQLYLKSEGKKVWKKYFFVLRASGLYYNPKGKGKSSKDLICLQKLDITEVYTAVSWKKKYKAPTDFGFALKHSHVQNKAPKYIKYICAEDQDSFSRWLTGIRIAKHGSQLLKNFKQSKKNLEIWADREILPNQNFAEYLAKQNVYNQEFAKEHHLLPRKNICVASTHPSGDLDLDKHSLSSGSSSQSDRSSTCSHERQGSCSQISVQSWEENTLPRKNSDVDSTDFRRGSLPSICEHRRTSMDCNQNQCSEEDLRLPGKMIPNIPVTTLITKQITDQNFANGTLKRRTSSGTVKPIKRNLSISDNRGTAPNSSISNNRVITPIASINDNHVTTLNSSISDNRVTSPNNEQKIFTSADSKLTRVPPIHSIMNGQSQHDSHAVPIHQSFDENYDDDDDYPLPPPPPELLNPPPDDEEEGAYSVINLNNPSAIYDLPNPPRKGTSLPNSPQKRLPVYVKAPIVGILPPKHSSTVSYSAPQSPSPHVPDGRISSPARSPYATPPPGVGMSPNSGSPAHSGHRRAVSSPLSSASQRRPPPPPRRSDTTKLSDNTNTPQMQYFIDDLHRVLTQKQAFSHEMPSNPSFPPEPPPHRPLPRQPSHMDEWLPPPPAELLVELHEARRQSSPPKPPPKVYMSPRRTNAESYA